MKGGVVLVTLALAAVAAPASAHAEWTNPLDVSPPFGTAGSPGVAVDSDGDAVFVWRRFDGSNFRIQARVRAAGGGALRPVQTLTDPGPGPVDPQVAVDADGDAVFVWERFDGTNDRIQARARSASGALSAVQTLSDAGQDAHDPQVAVDPAGNAVFTWVRFDGTDPGVCCDRIQARARTAGGTLSAVQHLSAAGRNADEPQVAVDSTGDAVFAWRRSDGSVFRAQTRGRTPAGALSPVQTLSGAGLPAFNPQLGVDTDGDAVFTWRRSDGADFRIQARARTAGGTLSTVQNLSAAGADADVPEVAVDPTGDAVFTWTRSDGIDARVQTRARTPGGALSAVQTLSGGGQDAFGPQVAVDDAGNAVFTWARSDGTDTRIQTRFRGGAGAALSPVDTLSSPGEDAFAHRVDVDPNGNATAVWVRSDGVFDRVQTAFGP